jgi:beta-glucosidase-like glycosyl hydrolase
MAEEAYQLRRGQYAKLDAPDSPSRASFEDGFGSSDEDIDEFDPLNYDESTIKRKNVRRRRTEQPAFSAGPGARTRRTWQKWLIPSRMCCFVSLIFVAALVLLLSAGGIWAWKLAPTDGQSPSWYPSPKGGTHKSWEESYNKAKKLVEQMTLVEKVNITTGTGWSSNMCVGNTGPVERLGFPSLCLQDGPLGIRFADNITAFPAGITVGATWNRDLMYKRGEAHGNEAKGKGVNVLLGPCVGPLGRSPLGGRNWEGFGTDPYLQGVAAAETVMGIQDQGVIATIKHYIANEQEHFRQSWEWGTPNAISSNLDDRALHELYAWPFADSVRAGVASVMCSYNQVNNSYACANSKLLNGILKDELGFQGFVQSDWLAQRSGVGSALAGLDVTMPGDGLRWHDGKSLWGGKLTEAVLNGSVPMERLNDMVTRVVASWYQMGQDGRKEWKQGPNFSSWTDEETGLLHPGTDDKTMGKVNHFVDVQGKGDDAHGKLVKQIAIEGTVLLKNENNILPLDRNGWKEPKDKDLKYRVGIFGEDSRSNSDGPNACKDRGCNTGTLASGWGSGAVEFPYLIAPLDAIRKAFNKDKVYVTDWPQNKLPKDQHQIVEDQDICIVFANSDAGEGYMQADGIKGDRNDLYLDKGGDDLIVNVANECGKGKGSTIVVIHSVGPVIMDNWIDLPGVKAVLLANLPGQESGNAITELLFGDANPSGHLPYTIAKQEKDYGDARHILKFPNNPIPQQNFTEGLYIDYRHFDKYDITPRYEFGFGLSYTTFALSDLKVKPHSATKTLLPAPRPSGIEPPEYDNTIPDPSTAVFPSNFRRLKNYIYPYIKDAKDIKQGTYPYPPGYDTPAPLSPAGGAPGGNPDLYSVLLTVSATLTNTGSRDGSAVVQLYISYPDEYKDEETGMAVDFPVKVLRGFDKQSIEKDGTTEVGFELTRRDLSYWSVRRQNWVLPTVGKFKVSVGFSSRDLPLVGEW